MSFSASELRLGMDVYSADGVLLGSVVQIRRRPRAEAPLPRLATESGGASAFSGESLGPMPTALVGNGGPAHQGRAARFGTAARVGAASAETEPSDILVFRTLVHLDWRTLWPKLRRYPVSLIQHVSQERIVLSETAAGLQER